MQPAPFAAFLDKDGTLIDDVPNNVDPVRIRLSRHAGAGLRLLRDLGFRLLLISNQSGVAHGLFPCTALDGVTKRLQALLAAEGVQLAGAYYCPHDPQGSEAAYAVPCGCRKPAPGLLLRAAAEHGLILDQCWMVGDILNDVEAGRRAGCRTVLINNGNETQWLPGALRKPEIVAADLLEAAIEIGKRTNLRDRRQLRTAGFPAPPTDTLT